MNNTIGFIIACIAFMALMWTVSLYALDRQAKIDCIQWGEDATHMLGYYVTPWQVEQCQQVGYPLNADIEVK